jgi:hypothetical protein
MSDDEIQQADFPTALDELIKIFRRQGVPLADIAIALEEAAIMAGEEDDLGPDNGEAA